MGLTVQPAFRITANSQDITALIADRLVGMTITDEAGLQSDRVTIELDDRDQLLDIPEVGAELKVAIGYAGTLVDKGAYTVDEVETSGGLRTMTIRASASDFTGTIGAPNEGSWHDKTLGEIVRTIAGRNKLTPSVHPDVAKIKITHADQNESDINFVTRMAAENGATAKVAGKRLVVTKRAPGESVDGKALPVLNVDGSDVSDWTAVSSSRGNYTGVRAYWHNTKTADRVAMLHGKEDKVLTLPHTYATKANAERAAKSKLQAMKNGKGTFRIGSMPGNPYIQADMRIQAAGFRRGVDGEWIVTRVEHRISGSGGYTSSVECESKDGDAK